jgi:hypothetical protein
MSHCLSRLLSLTLLGVVVSAMGTTYDNRFIPQLQHPFITVEDRPSHGAFSLFFATADNAIGEHEDDVGIPELFGKYDLRDLAKAVENVCSYTTSPLSEEFRGKELPWTVHGKIQAQGLDLAYQQAVNDWFSFGFDWFLMRVESRQMFYFQRKDAFTRAQELKLDEERRMIHEKLCLRSDHSKQVGMGDMDAYIRFNKSWDYTLKFRHVDLGFRIGALLPIGQAQINNCPASIPFGGNKHFGMYISADTELELKEDWKFGMMARLSKRVSKTALHRMPVGCEPSIFGGVVGCARVCPGVTFNFAPYFSMENVREGLGFQIQYALTIHDNDSWTDERVNKKIPVKLGEVCEKSEWASDYFSLNVFYDFGKMKVTRGHEPIVRFACDIPAAVVVGKGMSKTYKVSLGLEFNF